MQNTVEGQDIVLGCVKKTNSVQDHKKIVVVVFKDLVETIEDYMMFDFNTYNNKNSRGKQSTLPARRVVALDNLK